MDHFRQTFLSMGLEPILLVTFVLALSSCSSEPRPRYTVDGLLIDLPEGSTWLDLRQLPGESIYKADPILIEQVPLPSPVDVQLSDSLAVRRDTAWRISISSEDGTFPVLSLIWHIWLGDTALTASESTDLRRMIAITFDDAQVLHGGPVSLSYGSPQEAPEPIAVIPPLK